MSRFVLHPTLLQGLAVLERQAVTDTRGFLTRLFCAEELQAVGWPGPVAQINHTATTRQGTVRGLHYQRAPHAEAKLVTCVRGEVWDVALDVRPHSPTYLQWHAQVLSAQNGLSYLIPPGFAHGYQTLCDDVELIYCHSAPYVEGAQAGVNVLDPRLSIAWPRALAQLSAKDAELPCVDALQEGVLP